MKKIFIITAGLIAISGIWFFISRQDSNQGQPVTDNNTATPLINLTRASDFSLQDYNGKTVSLSDFAGKPVVVNSWAAWCPFCREELPDFATIQKEFGDKVIIIAINRQESLATAKGYTDKQGTSRDLIFLLDPDDSFYKSIGGFSMPETIFVNKNGEIIVHKRGPMDIQEIREKIQQLISQ